MILPFFEINVLCQETNRKSVIHQILQKKKRALNELLASMFRTMRTDSMFSEQITDTKLAERAAAAA